MIANLILMGPTNLRPALDSLDRPALFIASSQDWAVEQSEIIREGWPEIQVEVIDDTEHALFVDKPDEFNRVLEEFLATLPD
jgi:pimeloyl-ACP methyl ester carboxylesterase